MYIRTYMSTYPSNTYVLYSQLDTRVPAEGGQQHMGGKRGTNASAPVPRATGPQGSPPRPRRAGLSLVVVWSAVASVVAPGTGQPSGLGFFGGGVVRVEVCVCVCMCVNVGVRVCFVCHVSGCWDVLGAVAADDIAADGLCSR